MLSLLSNTGLTCKVIRTDHAPLRSVLKAKDPEGQLARWIEFLSTFDFEIQYRLGQRHQSADALSCRPCDDRCKGWKSQKQVSFVDVGIQTEMQVPNQDNEQAARCESPVGDRCATVKLEPMWTSAFLRKQQEIGSDLKIIIGWKIASERKPLWEDMSPHSCAVKTLWSQWGRFLLRNGVLCRKWENDIRISHLTRFFSPTVSDRLLLKLTIVTRLQAFVVYGRPYALFSPVIIGQDLHRQFTDWSPVAMFVDQRKCWEKNIVHL